MFEINSRKVCIWPVLAVCSGLALACNDGAHPSSPTLEVGPRAELGTVSNKSLSTQAI